jgi:uncharacterized protein (TIGR03000 family)
MVRSSAVFGAFIASLAALLSAAPAKAQLFNHPSRSYGVGAGLFSGKGGYSGYTGPAVDPLDYPGYYSKFGSPAPTYAPVASTVGGTGNRVHQNAPFFGMGLGWWGHRSPSPRPNPNFTYNAVVTGPSTAEPPLLDGSNEPAEVPKGISLTIEVHVPVESAVVSVNGQPTKQGGNVRLFSSPALPEGQSYEYDVRAEWVANGKKMNYMQTVTGKPGERVVADFGK